MKIRFWIINNLAKILFLNPDKCLFKLLTYGLEPGKDYTVWKNYPNGFDSCSKLDMVVPVHDPRNIHVMHELESDKKYMERESD